MEACSSGKVFRLLLLPIRQTLPLFQTKKFNFPVPSLQSWSLKFVPFPRSGLLNPYLFSDFQTKMVKIPLQPISDQNGSKTIPFGAGYTYIAYVGELPPPPPPLPGTLSSLPELRHQALDLYSSLIFSLEGLAFPDLARMDYQARRK